MRIEKAKCQKVKLKKDDDGKPAVCEFWYLPSKGTGYWHRIDGPAVVYNKKAMEDKNSVHKSAWWIHDRHIPNEEMDAWLAENNIDPKSKDGQLAILLRWA